MSNITWITKEEAIERFGHLLTKDQLHKLKISYPEGTSFPVIVEELEKESKKYIKGIDPYED